VRFDDEVDARTRTMGVVIAVDRPYDKVIPGYRPPLSKGMFVQVVLRGKPHRARLLVPRSAVRAGAVLGESGQPPASPPGEGAVQPGVDLRDRSGVDPR